MSDGLPAIAWASEPRVRSRWGVIAALLAALVAVGATTIASADDAPLSESASDSTDASAERSLPPYPRLSIAELLRASGRDDDPLVVDRTPFVVLGTVDERQVGDRRELELISSMMLCCSVHMHARFRLEAAAEAIPGDGELVAVFGRLRRPADGTRSRRGVIGWASRSPGVLIEAERIVPAAWILHGRNVVELLDSPFTSTFARAVREAGLDEQLSVLEPVTVLAPVDHAFESMSEAERDALFDPANRDALRALVLRHILRDALLERELVELASVTAMDHGVIPVDSTSNGVRVGGARTLYEDRLASNGVIHMVDRLVESSQGDDPATPLGHGNDGAGPTDARNETGRPGPTSEE